MTISGKVSGTYRSIIVSGKVSGTWRTILTYGKVGGVWKPLGQTVQLEDDYSASDLQFDFGGGAFSNASITFNRAGSVTTNGNGAGTYGDWVTGAFSTVGDGYEIIFNTSSSSGSVFGTLDTWLALSSDRGVSCDCTIVGVPSTWTGTVQIRLAGGGAVQDTGNLTVTAQVDSG